MMNPQEESLEQIDIEPMPRVIESKPTYVEFSLESGDTANDLMTTKTPVVAEVEEEVLGVGAVSSTRSYYSKMWKFIVPLTLIAAVSGTIATVSRYEANAKEARRVEQNYPPKPTSDADNLLYVAPETKMLNVSKVGSRTKGSKTSPKEEGGAGDFNNEIDGGSLSMSIMMFGIYDAGGDKVPSLSSQPQFITTAKAEKASKGSKTILGGNSDSGFETTGSGVERVESLSMSIMMFGIDKAGGDTLSSSSFQPQFINAKAEKASKGSKTILGGNTGSETTGSGVEGVESMSMITMVEIGTHEFNMVNAESSSQQGLLKASKGSKTTKASKETTSTTTTTVEPDVESSSSGGGDGGGSMSMESTERSLEEDYTIFGDSEVEVQNGPVFYRRKYIDNHLL